MEWPQEETKSGTESVFQPVSLAELLAREYNEPEWLIDRLIPADGVTVMGGAPAVFKTWTYLHIAVAIATGQKLFDQFQTVQGGVLIVDEDNGYREMQKRLKMIGAPADLPIYFLSHTGFKLNPANNLGLLTSIKERGIRLIILDPLVRVHDGEENDSKSMSAVYTSLLDFIKAGVTVLCVHHNRKPGANHGNAANELRGSSDILASAFCHLALERQRDDSTRVVIRQTKIRNAQEIDPILLQAVSGEDWFRLDYLGAVTKGPSKLDQARETILEVLSAAGSTLLCVQDIQARAKEFGKPITDTTFKNAASELKQAEEVFTKRGVRKKEWYSLQPFAEDGAEADEPVV